MTLKEFFEQNGNKPIEIQENGTIKVLEEKGPWKPETGERYYVVSDIGAVGALCWCNDEIDKRKLDIGNVFRTKSEAARALHRLKARKKFLDAGGHEGMDGYEFGNKYHVYPQRGENRLNATIEGNVTAFDIWFETEADCNRAINSLSDDEKAALCWMGESE